MTEVLIGIDPHKATNAVAAVDNGGSLIQLAAWVEWQEEAYRYGIDPFASLRPKLIRQTLFGIRCAQTRR